MAGEYSRELSVKFFANQPRLIELGFRQCGAADEEVALVNKIYRLLIGEDLPFQGIADRLNEEGVTTNLDWS